MLMMGKRHLFSFFLLFILSLESSFGQTSVQKCVLEKFTGSWVGYEPDASVILEDILQTYPNSIPVCIHDNDAMVITEGNYINSFYSPTYPSAMMNRLDASVPPNQWATSVSTVLSGLSSATVEFDSVWYNTTTRQLDIDLRVTFTGNESGMLRFNCIVVEDSVTGTGSGYTQTNYDNSTAGHPYFGAGNPIINYVHRHVARSYLGGAFGTSGIIPSSVTVGSTYEYHYTYTLPIDFDVHQITLVGLVSDYGTSLTSRYILNAESFDLDNAYTFGLGTEELLTSNFSIYPNPASHHLTVNFNTIEHTDVLRIYSLEGKLIISIPLENTGSGVITVSVEDLVPGQYVIRCGTFYQRFTVYDY